MNDHVAKPVNPGNLYATLIKWLTPAVIAAGTRRSPTPAAAALSNAAQATIAALEKVPGLDSAYGLRAMRGKLASYLRLLGIFLDSHGRDPEKISTALNSGDITQAEHIAHGLKGVSGTLGLKGIYEAALALNNALRESAEPTELARLVAALGQRVRETKGALSPIIAAAKTESQ